MSQVLLRVSEVTKSFGPSEQRTTVLYGVELEIRAGELTLLMGPSGSGKTTLVSILAGLLRPTSGKVELCGEPISDLDEAAVSSVRRRRVGFIFQTYNLFPALTALDNVALGYRMRGQSKPESRANARTALASVGLASRTEYLPAKLSSGQKQRVAVARALAGDPPVVLGDEPTAALDGPSAMSVMVLLRERVTPESAVLVVTHDHRLERYAHRTVYMEDGRIVSETRHDVNEGG
ncbi:MAG TPA: ABC transporter ATP-binding protein [Polyangiales bacterium]|nr:ABC transporter ATP-binding protein [Polyangiales bacterium]